MILNHVKLYAFEELYAIYLALGVVLQNIDALKPNSKIHILSDSQYSIGVLSKGWKRNKNQLLIQWIMDLLSDVCNRHTILFHYVSYSGTVIFQS
eukprot:UN14288